jgi:hypothetical protein
MCNSNTGPQGGHEPVLAHLPYSHDQPEAINSHHRDRTIAPQHDSRSSRDSRHSRTNGEQLRQWDETELAKEQREIQLSPTHERFLFLSSFTKPIKLVRLLNHE